MDVGYSTVPAALDALMRRWTLALPDDQVVDGQPVDELQGNIVLIGFTGAPGEAAIVNTTTRRGYGTDDRESYDIACLVSAWPSGDNDMQAARDYAYGMIRALAADLVREQTLDGAVQRARLSAGNAVPEQTTAGAVFTVRLTVHVDAYTGRR